MVSLASVKERCNHKVESISVAFQSRRNFVKAIETKETAYGHTEERSIWKNEDLDLTPPPSWTWAWYNYAAFWWSYGMKIWHRVARTTSLIMYTQASPLVFGLSARPWFQLASHGGKVRFQIKNSNTP